MRMQWQKSYYHQCGSMWSKKGIITKVNYLLLIEELTDLEGASKKLYIRLPVLSDSYRVQKIIQNYPGQTPIVLVDSKRVAKAAPRDWNVKVDEELMSTLQAVFGKENVILR